MRIACVYLPSFQLQAHVRRAPHLAGKAVAAIGNDDSDRRGGARVLACSRAAWKAGVRPGMAAGRARALIPNIETRRAPASFYRRALEAVAESLMALSVHVDLGIADDAPVTGHHALYLRVPTGTRGDAFGAKVLAQIARQGFRGRVGIADDRFSAWAAAATMRGVRVGDPDHDARPFAQTCTSVPRGASAAFLSPLPLKLLPIEPNVLQLLGSLGVRTLGDFASLPPPSLATGFAGGVDLRALARGDDSKGLRAFTPSSPVVEAIELGEPLHGIEPLTFLLRPLFDRACERLRGRGMAADRLAVRIYSQLDEITVEMDAHKPTLSARALVDLARSALSDRPTEPTDIQAVEVVILREAEPEDELLLLFDAEQPESVFRLTPFMSPARESHRRTMRGRRGKRGRRRRRSEGSAEPATRNLFD